MNDYEAVVEESMGNVERVTSSFMGSFLVWAILVLDLVLKVSGNAEGGWLPFVLYSMWF